MQDSWNILPCHFDNYLLHFLNLSSVIQKSENQIFFGSGYHHRLLPIFQVSASLVHTLHIIQTNDTLLHSLTRYICCSIHYIAFCRYASNKMCALITLKIKKLYIDMQKLFFEIAYNIFVLFLHLNLLFYFYDLITSQSNSHLPSPFKCRIEFVSMILFFSCSCF